MNNHTYIVSRGLLFAAILFAATLSFAACGVKNGYVVGEYGKYPLSGEIIAAETNDSVQAVKGTMGLLWQGDTLRITLNQGRQLLRAKTGKDTLYLYEAPRGAESNLQAQAVNDTTRQYTFYIPTRELFIIKYNDSLVYPVMPTTEPCNYPLEIKSLLTKKIQKIKKAVSPSQETENIYKASASNSYPDGDEKSIAGTYYWGHYIEPFLQKMQLDTTHAMKISQDGLWKEYRNDSLVNCGIIRRHQKIKGYVMLVDAPYEVLMTDTKEINGHIHPIGDMWPYLRNGGRLPVGEYFCTAYYYMTEFRLYPSHSMSLPHSESLITLGSILICNGEVYGWGKKSKDHTYK